MRVFVDTSALYIALDRSNTDNTQARQQLNRHRADRDALVTHNYVISEACALVQRRLGARPAVELFTEFVPLLDTVWVSESVHQAAVSRFIAAASRSVSLVDLVSFEVMRREGIEVAFAFDDDFLKAGFRTVP